MLKVKCYENKECEFIRQLNQIGHHSFPYSVTTPSSIPLFGNLTRLHRETPHPLFGKHPFPYSSNDPFPYSASTLSLFDTNTPSPIRHSPLLLLFGIHLPDPATSLSVSFCLLVIWLHYIMYSIVYCINSNLQMYKEIHFAIVSLTPLKNNTLR